MSESDQVTPAKPLGLGESTPPASLRRAPEFMKFWSGQSASLLGSQFSLLALPLTAVLVLHASPGQMGLLGASLAAPGLFFGLVAGVWLDRTRRRPVLVIANTVSAATLATVPGAALVHLLTIEQLYAVALISGTSATFFTVAQTAFLPTLAGRANLVEANSMLQTSRTFTALVGPGLAGAAVQAITAPMAVALDAGSFLVGASTAWWVRASEPTPERSAHHRFLGEAWEGLTAVWRQPLMRSITLSIVAANLFPFVTSAVFLLLFAGQLGVTPIEIGAVFATAGVSGLLGAQAARPLIRRGGLGPVMLAGAGLFSVGPLFTLAAALGTRQFVLPVLLSGAAVAGFGLMVYNINQLAIRQAVVPDRLLGRTSAVVVVVSLGGQVIGSLMGGAIGQAFGLRAALLVGTLGTCLCVLPAVFSPLRSLRDVPAPSI
jgi:MFS family permease